MNVKPGDLAVIVRDYFKENIGLVVDVLRPADGRSNEWVIRSCGRPIKFEWAEGDYLTGEVGFSMEADEPDAALRPILPPPGAVTDDEVAELYDPRELVLVTRERA